MKIAYNPKTSAAITEIPENNDITFDLSGLNIYTRGVKFKGTDTTYSVFKKATTSGGYNGLVPAPDYNNGSKNRLLKEDGTWTDDYVTLTTVLYITGKKTISSLMGITNGDINDDNSLYVRPIIYMDSSKNMIYSDTKANTIVRGSSIKFQLSNGNDALLINTSSLKSSLPIISTLSITGTTLVSTTTTASPLTVNSNILVSKLNADLLDGYHASGLFTDLSNNGLQISATIGGTKKNLTVGYAELANLLRVNSTSTSTVATAVGGWTPVSGKEYVYRQRWTNSAAGSDTADLAIYLDGNLTANMCIDGYYFSLKGFKKGSSSDNYILLGGGGHKLISDFATSGHTHNYAGSNTAGGAAISALSIEYNNDVINTNYGRTAYFLQTADIPTWPHTGWFNSIKMLHNNSTGFFTEIATSFTGEDGMWRRSLRGGTQKGWYKILDSGNYNSYAPTLTGDGASGTWGINISGNAATATNATNSTYTSYNKTNSITEANFKLALYSGFYRVTKSETSEIPNATASGNVAIHAAWDNGNNIAGLDILINDSIKSNLYYRSRVGYGIGAWRTLLDSSNYTSYVNPKATSKTIWGLTYIDANGNFLNVDGLLYVTANGNTTTIGSLRDSWCHIYNSADIPFIFNKSIYTVGNVVPYDNNTHQLGDSSKKWKHLYLSNRAYLDEWIQFSGSSGLYWSNTNGVHLYANTTTSYGGLITLGSRGGYCGLHCGPDNTYMTVMSSADHLGLYNESKNRWLVYYNKPNDRISIYGSGTDLGYGVLINQRTGIKINSYPSLHLARTDAGEASMYFSNNTAGWAIGVAPWGVGAGLFAIGLYSGTGSSNWRFKIDNNGYCFTRSYLNLGAGNEKNASNPPYVWGVNGSDNYLRTYATSSLSVGSASKLTTARKIWGLSFDGTADVNGHLSIGKIFAQQHADRAELSMVSSSDVPCDLWLGANGELKWSITARHSSDSYALSFYSMAAGHVMRILPNGSVGIGTTSPEYKLLVKGNIALFESLYFTREHYNYITVPSNNGLLAFNIGVAGIDNTKMLINNSGNVGIGTTSPNYKLDVNGTGKFNQVYTTGPMYVGCNGFSPTGDWNEGIRLYGTATDSTWSKIDFGCAIGNIVGSHSNQWSIGRNSSNRFVITHSTKSSSPIFTIGINENFGLGMGNNEPSHKLHVIGTTYTSSTIGINRSWLDDKQTSAVGPITMMLTLKSYGYPIYTDPEFASSLNEITVYNNSSNGSVTIIRIADNLVSGNSSGYILQISTSTEAASPGRGGFVLVIPSRANAIFVQIFRAKIPTGFSVVNAENVLGSGATYHWLTSREGTGKWEWYIRVTHCGSSGSFSSGGHVYLNGSGAVTWYLSYCNVIDITKGNYDGLRTRYSDTATNIYVNQHTSNNVEYPLIWSNLNNSNSVSGNLLYKSYANLTYNPSLKRVISGLFSANNPSGPHFLGVSTSGNWAYLRLHNSTCYWDIATKNNSGSGGLWLARYNGSNNGIFVSTGSLVGLSTNNPSERLTVNGNIKLYSSAANLYILSTATDDNQYAIIRFGNKSNDNAAIMYLNGSARTDDGGVNTFTIRNGVGNLRLDNATTITGNQTLYGLTSTCNAGNNANYANAAVQIREFNFGGAQSDTWAIAPRLAWHWLGRVAAQIGLGSSGYLYTAPRTGTTFYKLVYESGTWGINITGSANYLANLTRETRYAWKSDNTKLGDYTGFVTDNQSYLEIRGFCPPTMYRTSHDRPAPFGLGFGSGLESGGIMPIGEAGKLQEIMFYGANSGPTIFTWKRLLWEGTNLLSTKSNYYSATMMSLDSSNGNFYVRGNITTNGMINSNYGLRTFIGGTTKAILNCTYTYYGAIFNAPTKNGRISMSTYPGSNDIIYIGYASSTQISNETNAFNSQTYWNAATGSWYATHYYESSDKKLKTNILDIVDYDNIPRIRQFTWKSSGAKSYGFIAQELEELGYDELVSNEGDYKTVNYTAALALVIAKLKIKLDKLEKEMKMLKNGKCKNSN